LRGIVRMVAWTEVENYQKIYIYNKIKVEKINNKPTTCIIIGHNYSLCPISISIVYMFSFI
jgi:hypothetical protein